MTPPVSNCYFTPNSYSFVAGFCTAAALMIVYEIFKNMHHFTIKNVATVVSKLPGADKVIDPLVSNEIKKLKKDIYSKRIPSKPFNTAGLTEEQIFAEFDQMEQIAIKKINFRRVSGAIYHNDPLLKRIVLKIWERVYGLNPNHSDLYSHTLAMSADVLRWCSEIFKGGFGTLTSGGSQSNFIALWTYREICKFEKPNIVIPASAHTSFVKAAKVLNIEVRKVPDKEDFTADVKAMAQRMDKNTIAIVGSAPSYMAGVVDDLQALSDLAVKKNVFLHVDACLGGFVKAFLPEDPFEPWKFPGVTTVSADVHKFGYATKGISLISFRDEKLRSASFHCDTTWNGGITFTARLEGSYPAEPFAAAWAAMKYFGKEGYTKCAIDIIKLANNIRTAVRVHIPELKIMGSSRDMVIGIQSKDESELASSTVCSEMNQLEWNLNPLAKGFHLCVTMVHVQDVEFYNCFINDLKACVAKVKGNSSLKAHGAAAVYGMTRYVPDNKLEDLGRAYLNIIANQPNEQLTITASSSQ